MFVLNDDLSIYANRGDIVFFAVKADDNGILYKFQPGDIVRMSIYGKKDAESCLMQKDFPVLEVCEEVFIHLEEEDTKIGEIISKPKDYWYEIVLNPDTVPQTIIGYDEDGPKVFRLFPESAEFDDGYDPQPEDFPVVDEELDMTSPRPVSNRAVASAVATILDTCNKTNNAVAKLYVTPEMLGATNDGETEFGDALQNYIDSVDADVVNIYFPPGQYRWSKTVTTSKSLNLRGDRGFAVITNDADVACLKANGICTISGLVFNATSAERNEFTIIANGGDRFRCYDSEFTCDSGALNGVHVENVTLSHIDRCLFNHSQISLKTWDCKITNTWVWALWRPYGIGIHGGSGNINLANVDVVPPFRTDSGKVGSAELIDGIKAGIWVNSEGGNKTSNVIMENIYLDGNARLNTGVGILCEDVFCVTVSSFRANRMTETPIVVDSCFDVSVAKGMFYENNKGNLGVPEVLVRNTLGSKHGYVSIVDNHFVNYRTDVTASAPAIKVTDGADEQMIIERNTVGQQPNMCAYGNVPIQTPTLENLHSNLVVGYGYEAEGSFVIPAGSSGKSLVLPKYLVKNPTQKNFRFWVMNGFLPDLRVQENGQNIVWVGVSSAPASDVTVHYEVKI